MDEARLRIASNNTIQTIFSTQDIVECSNYSQGCEIGFPYLVSGKYGEDYGVIEENCNPYTGKDGKCGILNTLFRIQNNKFNKCYFKYWLHSRILKQINNYSYY